MNFPGSLEGSFSPSSPTDSFSHLATPSVRGVAVEAHGFQQRRKRAEKLSSFFGVEYRELFTEVLDVIESEVQLDSMSGSLSPEETQVCNSLLWPASQTVLSRLLQHVGTAGQAQKTQKSLIINPSPRFLSITHFDYQSSSCQTLHAAG